MTTNSSDLVIDLQPRRGEVTLVVRAEHEGTDHRAAALPLPPLFEVTLAHRAGTALSRREEPVVSVQEFPVECRTNKFTCPLNRLDLFVGETYIVRVGCSARAQARVARRRVQKLLGGGGAERTPSVTEVTGTEIVPYGGQPKSPAKGGGGGGGAKRGGLEWHAPSEPKLPHISLAWLDVEPETAEAAWARRELDLKAEQALAEVRRWMEEHDVHFDGAMDPRVRESKLGVPQAWAIESLDEAKAKANRQLLDGIADVMKTHPELECEVHGSTGKVRRAPEVLASHFGLDAERDVQSLMDRLADCRARACLEALVARGVPRANLFATAKGNTVRPGFRSRAGGEGSEALKVDFIPRVKAANALAEVSEKGALRRARNKEILDGVADALLEFPATKLEVHGCRRRDGRREPPAVGDALLADALPRGPRGARRPAGAEPRRGDRQGARRPRRREGAPRRRRARVGPPHRDGSGADGRAEGGRGRPALWGAAGVARVHGDVPVVGAAAGGDAHAAARAVHADGEAAQPPPPDGPLVALPAAPQWRPDRDRARAARARDRGRRGAGRRAPGGGHRRRRRPAVRQRAVQHQGVRDGALRRRRARHAARRPQRGDHPARARGAADLALARDRGPAREGRQVAERGGGSSRSWRGAPSTSMARATTTCRGSSRRGRSTSCSTTRSG